MDLPGVTIGIPRSSKEVAQRLNILSIFLAISDDKNSQSFFVKYIDEIGMTPFLTEKEKRILTVLNLTSQEEIDLSWCRESIYTLAWCLGLFPTMQIPINEADINPLFMLLPPEINIESFIRDSILINQDQLVEECEFYYALHWAKRHPEGWAFLQKLGFRKFNMSIIIERRRALEWVIDSNIDWDEVELNT